MTQWCKQYYYVAYLSPRFCGIARLSVYRFVDCFFIIHKHSSGALHKLYAPLPPLREQYHIVKKIEELMPFVNQYATVSEKLDKLNSEFPDQVKKSILQLAVEGKLVGLCIVERPVCHYEVADVLVLEVGEISRTDVGVHAMQILGLDHIERADA